MTTVGVGAVAGPAIGGVMVDWLGWRAVFFLNIPLVVIGIGATAAVLRGWESDRAPKGSSFDWVGAALSTERWSRCCWPDHRPQGGWDSPTIVLTLVLSGALFLTFIWWELRCPSPMLDLRFFRFRVFSFGVSAAFLTFLGSSAVLFLMPFYLQNVLGYSPKVAGLVIVPGALCMAVMGSVAGVLSDRFGWRWFTVGGMLCSTAGLLVLSRVTETSSLWLVTPALILMNTGMGTFYSPNTSSVLSAVGRESYGVVSGFLNLVRNSANVVSLAIATSIVAGTMGSLGFEPSLEAVRGDTVEGVKNAFTVGMRYAFYVMTALVVCSATVSFLQGRRPLAVRQPAQQPQEEPATGD